jgi:hypothetical protein
MAFVYFEERFKEKEDDSKNKDGPGAYEIAQARKTQPSGAPFLSKVPRDKKEKEDPSLTTPGPGSYTNVDPPGANKLEILELNLRDKKIVINNSKPSYTFCSDSKRFQNQGIKKDVPGPGYYTYDINVISSKVAKNNKAYQDPLTSELIVTGSQSQQNLKPADLVMPKNSRKAVKVPSIPAGSNKFGYNIDDREAGLIPNVYPEKTHDGTKRDCVGPGEYSVKGYFDQCKDGGSGKGKAIPWKRAVSQRLRPAPPSNAGPGAYDPNFNYAPLYKWKASSSFSSQSSRSGALVKMSTAAKLKERNMRFTNLSTEVDDDFEDDFEYLEVRNLWKFGIILQIESGARARLLLQSTSEHCLREGRKSYKIRAIPGEACSLWERTALH